MLELLDSFAGMPSSVCNLSLVVGSGEFPSDWSFVGFLIRARDARRGNGPLYH